MIVYNYDLNGFYTGESEADESPLEPGVFLIPALATELPVPTIPAGSLARFVNGAWTLEAIPVPVVDPAPAPQPYNKAEFTSLEFLDRFTEAEQLGVVTATLQNAQIKLWYDKMLAASYVDINDPRTAAGIDALIAAGLIAADRRTALLAPEVVQP